MNHIFIGVLELLFTLVVSYFTVTELGDYMRKGFDFQIHEEIIQEAFNVLNEVVNKKFQMSEDHFIPSYQVNQLKIQGQDDYCIRSDTYKYYHPDSVLQDTYLIREISVELPKQIVQERTFDLFPFLQRRRKPSVKQINQYFWPVRATLIFMHYDHLNNEYLYGKEIQSYSWKIFNQSQKQFDGQQLSLVRFTQREKEALGMPCIRIKYFKIEIQQKNASFLPQTFRLYKKEECKEFFTYLNSTQYKQRVLKQGPVFITKAGEELHRGKGINVLFDEQQLALQTEYEFGNLCAQKQEILIAQQYISNPYLYKGHKIEFRIYFTITSTSPLIVHAYKKALIKRCAKPFSIFSTEKASHVCNTAIVKKAMADEDTSSNESGDMKKEDIEEELFFIDWYLEALQDLLLSQGKIKNLSWLEESLYPRVYRQIIHLVRSGWDPLYRDPRLGEFFAVDFLLTDDLEIYVLECNYNPQILSVTPERIRRNYKMVMDTVELFQAYTRSRYVRIKNFVNQLLNYASKLNALHSKGGKQLLYPRTAGQFIRMAMNETRLEKEFFALFQEKLDDNFQVSPDNLYQKIIDENLKGPAAYHYLINKECL